MTTRSHERSRVRATTVTGCSRRTVPTTLPRDGLTYKNPAARMTVGRRAAAPAAPAPAPATIEPRLGRLHSTATEARVSCARAPCSRTTRALRLAPTTTFGPYVALSRAPDGASRSATRRPLGQRSTTVDGAPAAAGNRTRRRTIAVPAGSGAPRPTWPPGSAGLLIVAGAGSPGPSVGSAMLAAPTATVADAAPTATLPADALPASPIFSPAPPAARSTSGPGSRIAIARRVLRSAARNSRHSGHRARWRWVRADARRRVSWASRRFSRTAWHEVERSSTTCISATRARCTTTRAALGVMFSSEAS